MAASRRKWIALACTAAAIAAAGIAAFAYREAIVERFWIHHLSSEDPAVRKAAGEQLRRIGTARAIPRLCEIIEREPKGDPEPLAALQAHPLFTVLQGCVERSGPGAAPALRRQLRDGRGSLTVLVAQVLWDLEPGNRESQVALRRAMEHREREVREWALEALGDLGVGTLPFLLDVLEKGGE